MNASFERVSEDNKIKIIVNNNIIKENDNEGYFLRILDSKFLWKIVHSIILNFFNK